MRCRQQAKDCSSDDNTDTESCFDTKVENSDYNTNPTDTNTDTDIEPDSMLRKLAKKHKLTNKKKEKTAMYVEDFVKVLQTNLTTTRKKYGHKRYRIYNHLFHYFAGFSANRPQTVLDFCYRHIIVSLLRIKEANTFLIPEIIYDPSLVLSLYVFLLRLILADSAFAALNFTSAKQLSKLNIRLGTNQLLILLKLSIANVFIFRKAITTTYSIEISKTEPLLYTTFLLLVKKLSVLTKFLQIHRLYSLRYGASNAFNQSETSDVSTALQNIIMQHADARTFVKHYFLRRVTADTAAIVRSLKPQYELMRAACRIKLTKKQFSLVNKNPGIQQLLAKRAELKCHFESAATKQLVYQLLSRKIFNEKQRQKSALLKHFTEDIKATLDLSDEMPLIQKRLVETVMTLPETTLEKKFRRRDAAIDAVAAYCRYKKSGSPRRRKPSKKESPVSSPNADPQVIVAIAEKQAVDAAILSVFTKKRPLICFVCFGRKSLSFEKRVYVFASPEDFTKHFKRKHLSQIKKRQKPYCNICPMQLEHKMHFQNHAFTIHSTVS
ncbi:hypothetical protein B0O99DRAFT_650275 [Bisporella sp. PMI_857]|nr:hypothetical protein B0O99DRAFT_650275 [Bisporella sp. PMI_857]